MNTSQQLAEKVAEKSDHQLLDMFPKACDWTPEALDAARTELQKRNIAIPTAAPIIPESTRTGGPPPKKALALSEEEELVVSLVRDEPEQLYNHKNQIAAITNRRLLYIRHAGISRSFEGSYVIESIDLHHVNQVIQATYFAVGGLLAGIIAVFAAIYIAYLGATGQMIGPGVIFIPLVVIPAGIALIFGLKRRVLIFETGNRNYKWISAPFKFRESEQVARSACERFQSLRECRIKESEFNPSENIPETSDDYIAWYHILVAIFLPYVGLPWGIMNLVKRRPRSGRMMAIISGILLALFIAINIAASHEK